MGEAEDSGNQQTKKWWKFLWNCNIPNKIKILCWQAFHNLLPTISNLTKGFCKGVRQHWQRTPFYCMSWPKEVRHFDDLLFWFFTTLPAEEMESFIVMRWRLWSERNKEVMNPTASGAVHSDYIWEWVLHYICHFRTLNS